MEDVSEKVVLYCVLKSALFSDTPMYLLWKIQRSRIKYYIEKKHCNGIHSYAKMHIDPPVTASSVS